MSNNKFKILLVEDDANISSFVETLLNTNGYQVVKARTCAAGVSAFLSHIPDLVILDLGLPDRDGMEFIRMIRKESVTPIIVLSARTTERDKVSALDLGANDYISKPFGNGSCWRASAPCCAAAGRAWPACCRAAASGRAALSSITTAGRFLSTAGRSASRRRNTTSSP